MTAENVQHLIAMIVYMLLVIGIGIYFSKVANKNTETYFLGGRSIGPWVTAFSAEASDMSGWLLMGVPGLAYWSGLADAGWMVIGLFLGTYLNWLLVSRRLRNYSAKIDAFTLPDFFSRRFGEKKQVILTISSLFIIVFFSAYVGQCLSACGTLFSELFGVDYRIMMLVAALFVLGYTFLGGYLAESASDFMQACVMIGSLVLVMGLGVYHAGGFSNVISNAKSFDGFFSLFRTATPSETTVNAFGAGKSYTFLSICTNMAWGLGYFGMPQVLLRFMSIRDGKELKRSRRVACVWLFIAMSAAMLIGVIGRSVPGIGYTSNKAAENIFIDMTTNFLPPILAGLACAGILAASISSADSYLLISTSALAKNIYHGLFKKDASDKSIMTVSRIAMAAITLFAMIVAWNPESTILGITAFAWAGLGATFGPLMLFSLFWRRTTHAGAVSGMLVGGITVFVWKLLLNPLGGVWGVYCLLPAFLLSCATICVVSLCTKEPDTAIKEEFDSVITQKA